MADPPAQRPAPGAPEDELTRSSAVFMAEVQRLLEMERRKRALDPFDPARLALAREIEDLAFEIVSRSRYQTRLIQLDAQERGLDTPPPRAPGPIIEDWRAAERRLFEARTALQRATDEADRLRDEHRRSVRSRPSSI